MVDSATAIDELVAMVTASAKYRHVADGLVRRIGTAELAKRRTIVDAVKATKNKLHQVAGAYLALAPHYGQWSKELAAAAADPEPATVRLGARRIMDAHASTRERLGFLDTFYAEIFATLPPVNSIADIACGFNPLAIPWLPLLPGTTYYAYDVYADMMAFLDSFMRLTEVNGHAVVHDVLDTAGLPHVDVALLLKAIPCLEQIDKSAGAQLLAAVPAGHLVVSYPVQSLGGRQKGMAANYEARFKELVAPWDWPVTRLEFPTELVFIVRKI